MSAKTEWDDDALTAIYYKELKDPIKDELSREDIPKDMNKLVRRAICIDNHLQDWRFEKRSNSVTWIPNQHTLKPQPSNMGPYYGPRPMELDIAQRKDRAYPKEKQRTQKKYSKKDKKRFNCRKKGHFKAECRSMVKEYEKKKGNQTAK